MSTTFASPGRFVVAARWLLVPYSIALVLIVWLPAAEASKVTGLVFEMARFVSEQTNISLSVSYAVFEFIANIALFVPLGVLLRTGFPRLAWPSVILIGFAASVSIELVQLLLPSRFATLSDVIANTLGGMLGWGITVGIRRCAHLRSDSRSRG